VDSESTPGSKLATKGKLAKKAEFNYPVRQSLSQRQRNVVEF